MNNLEIKTEVKGERLLVEILRQNEALRNTDEIFKGNNGWIIESFYSPLVDVDKKKLYINGVDKEHDGCATHQFNTHDEALETEKSIKQVVGEYNNSLAIKEVKNES